MKKILITLIIIILVLLMVGVYFYWLRNRASITRDNFSILTDIASDEEKSQWLTYTNTTAKYSLKYPPGLEIDALSDRTVDFMLKKGSSEGQVNFAVFYQDEFDGQTVFVNDQASFKKEVDRRTTGLFREDDNVIRHETLFMGKPTIVLEDNSNNKGSEIFIWHGNQILQIEIYALSNDQAMLSKILSTFTFQN